MFLWASGHAFSSTDQHMALIYVFLFKDTFFNIYERFINTEHMPIALMHAWTELI